MTSLQMAGQIGMCLVVLTCVGIAFRLCWDCTLTVILVIGFLILCTELAKGWVPSFL